MVAPAQPNLAKLSGLFEDGESQSSFTQTPRDSIATFKDRPRQVNKKLNRGSKLMRSLSLRGSKSKNMDESQTIDDSTEPQKSMKRVPSSTKSNMTKSKSKTPFYRNLARTKTICEKLTGSKPEPLFGSRVATGKYCVNAKEAILAKYPRLAIQACTDSVTKLITHGLNSLRAETLDMHSMVYIMHENRQKLSHRAVESFFEWLPLFVVYLERFMLVDEHVIVRWVESSGGVLRGELRQSARMKRRGSMQHQLSTLQKLSSSFTSQLPAGERLQSVRQQCDVFTEEIESFCKVMEDNLIPIVKEHISDSDVRKARTRIVKHVIQFVGYQDFLAIYTRWMRAADLLEWKATVLLPCDFKFFSYGTWDKDMDIAHYQIAATFGECIQEENWADEVAAKEMKKDFEKARMSRLPNGSGEEADSSGGEEEDEEEDGKQE